MKTEQVLYTAVIALGTVWVANHFMGNFTVKKNADGSLA